MSVELAINAAWAATLWAAVMSLAAMALILLRCRAVIRRSVCRLGLLGVPVVLAGAGAMHYLRPSAGLLDWPAGRADVRAAPAATVAGEDARGEGGAERLAAEPRRSGRKSAYPPHRVVRRDEHADDGARAVGSERRKTIASASGSAAGNDGSPAPVAWGALAVGAALLVSGVFVLVLVWRVVRLARWRRQWAPASAAWAAVTRRVARRMGLRAEFSVYVAAGLTQPAAAGVVDPAIVLPERPGQAVGPALRGALAHELGHLAGRDPLWCVVARGVAAAAWWCPPVWWLSRRGQIESELAADDRALDSGARPMDLARTLVRLAEQVQDRNPVGLPSMGCRLKRRIEMMIDKGQSHETRITRPTRWVLAAAAVLAAVTLVWTPLVRVARAEDKEGERREVKREKEVKRDKEHKADERKFVAANHLVCDAKVVNGHLQAVGWTKGEARKQLWTVRLGPVEGKAALNVRYDGPFVVVTRGKTRYIICGRTGRVVKPDGGEGERRREGERGREPRRDEHKFIAAERIVCKAKVVEGHLIAEGRAKSMVAKRLWTAKLGRIEVKAAPAIRYDGPYVVVTSGRQRFIIEGRTGRLVKPGGGEGDRKREGEVRREGDRKREGEVRREGDRKREGREAGRVAELEAQIRRLRQELERAQELLKRLERESKVDR